MSFCIQRSKMPVKYGGFTYQLKRLGQTPDKQTILVDNFDPINGSAMELFPGFLVPSGLNIEEVDLEGMPEVMVKFSPFRRFDQSLVREQKIINDLDGVSGVPKIINSGKVEVAYWEEKGQKTSPRPYFVMPKLPGSDLTAFTLKQWEDSLPSRYEVATLTTEILPALAKSIAQIHEKGYVHRDIKPDNGRYDLSLGALSLMDFGCANGLDQDAFQFFVGTYGYSPPEIKLDVQEGKEDRRTDIYAFAMTCFTMLTGQEWLLYGDMPDPAPRLRIPFGREAVIDDYYRAISAREYLSTKDLVALSNMPGILKETKLARYLAMLGHPKRYRRPANMNLVATTLRHLGGQLLKHEVWSAG